MADQTAESEKKKATPSSQEDSWRSRRLRMSLLGFRRGRGKEWYFSGQQPDEEVRLVIRRHWWFLVEPALPLIGSIVALLLMIWAAIALPGFGPLWYLLELAAFISIVVTGGWFAYKDLVAWWYETFIITNQRLIIARGLLEPKRKITTLDKVQQVGIDMGNFWGLIVGFGSVHVYLQGGDKVDMLHVPDPRGIRNAVLDIKDEIASGKKKDAPPIKPHDEAMLVVLEKLAKEKAVPELPDADAHLPPLRNSERFLGPRRTFGGILHIPCDVHYASGEHTVKYIQRSRYVLWRNWLIPICLLVLLFPLAILAPSLGWVTGIFLAYWWFTAMLLLLGILISMLLVYMNYADDVYIVTNRRVIDIERFFIFFSEKHEEAELNKIVDIKVTVESVLQRFLDIGHVLVETPGKTPNIVFSNVDHPFLLQDEISAIRTHRDKVDSAKKENNEKKNLYNWFANVVNTLDDTTTSKGTPNLRTMDLLSAMACAQEFGFDVVVAGEAISNSHILPGCVLRQNPLPGTIMEKGSQIEVVLSRRPVPVMDPDYTLP